MSYVIQEPEVKKKKKKSPASKSGSRYLFDSRLQQSKQTVTGVGVVF